MTPRLALLALAVSLLSCGDDDAPPAAPQHSVLRPSGELLPWDLSAIVPIDSVRAMPPGTPSWPPCPSSWSNPPIRSLSTS